MSWFNAIELKKREEANIQDAYDKIPSLKSVHLVHVATYIRAISECHNSIFFFFMKGYQHRERQGYMYSNSVSISNSNPTGPLRYFISKQSRLLAEYYRNDHFDRFVYFKREHKLKEQSKHGVTRLLTSFKPLSYRKLSNEIKLF
ncbi:hypothetical protein K501DRAFT_267350 [Backusella circina FSU 941]|nr:hypothetical protein K501DRAFT_267350 [Backusella circina FSU 941]